MEMTAAAGYNVIRRRFGYAGGRPELWWSVPAQKSGYSCEKAGYPEMYFQHEVAECQRQQKFEAGLWLVGDAIVLQGLVEGVRRLGAL
jgi:hypothetical protein